MGEYVNYIIPGIFFIIISYFIIIFIFDLLLRGFVPFIPSRPWVVDHLLEEIKLNQENPKLLALSTGRSGFFHALEKKYPKAILVGVETSLFPYLIGRAQLLIRRSKITVKYSEIYRFDVSDKDFIYSHLYPDDMEGLGRKLKFECKPGTIIVSTGFNIPHLIPSKIVELPDRKAKFDFFSKNQKLFQRKSKKYKKEKKAYFYEI